jgi:hypothetical protein
MGKKSRSGFEIRIRDEHPGSYFRELRDKFLGFKILEFFDAYVDPNPGSGNLFDPGFVIRDGKNSDPINILEYSRCLVKDKDLYNNKGLTRYVLLIPLHWKCTVV